MTNKEVKTDIDSASLFVEATSFLSAAVDLIFGYAENSNNKEDGSNMFKVHTILTESLKRFNEYEEAIYG